MLRADLVLRFTDHGQTHRQGAHILRVRHNQRPQVVIPLGDEEEKRQCRHGGPRHRQRNREQDAHMAGPINLCGLEYLLLHAQERLPEQERAKHAGDIGDDDPLVGVDPVQARQRDVVGDQRELARDHHPGQHHHED